MMMVHDRGPCPTHASPGRGSLRRRRLFGIAVVAVLATGCKGTEAGQGSPGAVPSQSARASLQRAEASGESAASAVPNADNAAPSQESSTPPESFSGGTEVSITNAVGLGCAARAKTGWLELLCRKKNGSGGRPVRAIRDLAAYQATAVATSETGEPPEAAPVASERPAASADSSTGDLAAADELANVIEPDAEGELRFALPWREGHDTTLRVEWTDTVYDLVVKGTKAELVLPVKLALRRACAKLEQASTSLVEQAKSKEGEGRLGAADVAKLPRFGVCQNSGLGAFALALGEISAAGAGDQRLVSASLNVVHVDAEGALLSVPFGTLAFAPQGLAMKPPMIYDYDDDGQHEFIVRYDIMRTTSGAAQGSLPAVYTLKAGKLQAYAGLEAMGPGSVSVEQLDFDMRPDLADHGPYLAWLPEACGANTCPGRLEGPRFFAYSLKDGSFSKSHENAKAALKRACAKAPDSIVVAQGKGVNAAQTALRLGCAKVWGVTEQVIQAELEQKRALLCGDSASCPLFGVLEAWAVKEPPVKL